MALQFRTFVAVDADALRDAENTIVPPPPDLAKALKQRDQPRDLKTQLEKGRSEIGPAPTKENR
jgi:hypothetical protein